MAHTTSHTWQHNARIFLALLRRDFKMLKSKIRSMIIDTSITTFIEILTFGSFFPLLGLPHEMIAPLYVGIAFAILIFYQGYVFSVNVLDEIPHFRSTRMEYQLILPLPKTWLFAEYILYFMIETFIITTPVIWIGAWILYDAFAITKITWLNWLLFFAIDLGVLTFCGIFFLALAFLFDYFWFRDNIWSRCLSWFFNLSAIFTTWYSIKKTSPIFAQIFLINPFTHATEALRAGLLGQEGYLPIGWSMLTLLVCSIIGIAAARHGIHKQLDPV